MLIRSCVTVKLLPIISPPFSALTRVRVIVVVPAYVDELESLVTLKYVGGE